MNFMGNMKVTKVFYFIVYLMLFAICYHLYNFKNVKNIHGGMLVLTKSNTPPWIFLALLKLYKRYQIAQSVSYFHHANLNIHRKLFKIFLGY